MGVAGLWDILKPAAQTRSLTELAVTEGFQANPRGLRGYRIGIDASIWFFHAEYGREGENPVLRTLFFRCASLMKSPWLPLFVFDGPKRPEFKRGKHINKTSNKLIPAMKRIVEAFGFEWRTAPGEAEAELAYLNRIGVIDGILSDDVDNFLFGALTVIRNQSNNLSGNKSNPILNSEGRDDKNHTRVFRHQDIHNHSDIQLTRGGLILIGLMSGGDYEGGLEGCGIMTAHAIARCGFGDSLFEAASTLSPEELKEFLVDWRRDLRHELKTNSRGHMARKALALSKIIPDTFPNIDVLLSYVQPVTSESLGHEGANPKITWSKEPNVAALASACELFFEWGYKEAIIKRFRTIVWPGIVLRILRRAVLDIDCHCSLPSTPRKSKGNSCNEEGYGTPSKMIAKHFAAINLNSDDDEGEQKPNEESRLIVGISRERTHASTDGLPEYRLEVAPAQLVAIAASGIQGLRQPEGPNEWESEESEGEDDDEGKERNKKGKTREPVDPISHLRLWLPVCMVDPVEKGLVENFRDGQERTKQKKALAKKKQIQSTLEVFTSNKTKRAPKQKKGPEENPEYSPPRSSQSRSPTPTGKTRTEPLSQAKTIEKFLPGTSPRPTPRPFPIEIATRREVEESSEDEGELPIIPIPSPRVKVTVAEPPKKPPTRSVPQSKTNQVAAIFNVSSSISASSIPASRAIEDTLALSDSDEELPMDLYQSTQPKKFSQSKASSMIPGYLSLSDSEGVRTTLTSHVKQKKQSSRKLTKQTTLSAFVGHNDHRKGRPRPQEDRPRTPPLAKSPRKSKPHMSPRGKERVVAKHTKGEFSVIVLSDESDENDGYTGVSRPVLAPLQLARNRTKRGLVPAHTKRFSASEIIDLT